MKLIKKVFNIIVSRETFIKSTGELLLINYVLYKYSNKIAKLTLKQLIKKTNYPINMINNYKKLVFNNVSRETSKNNNI